jgi:hypothetical protein
MGSGYCRIYSLSAAPSLSQSVEIAWQSSLPLAQYFRLWSVRGRYHRHPLGRPSRREPIADVAELAGYGRNVFRFPHCRRFLRYRSTKPPSKMVRMRMSRRVFSRKYLLDMDRGISEHRLQRAYGLQADMLPLALQCSLRSRSALGWTRVQHPQRSLKCQTSRR